MTKPIDRAEMKAQTRKLLQTAQVSPKGMTALYCACLFLLSLLEALIPGPELVSTFLSILTTLAEWIDLHRANAEGRTITGFQLCSGVPIPEYKD